MKSLAVPLILLVLVASLQAQQKPRVFVGESNSWELRGSGGAWANNGNAGAWSSTAGGARGQTAEIIKTVTERCPDVVVNDNQGIADYSIRFDHEGGKGVLRRRNKIAVFNRIGDSIFADSTRSLGNSIKDACAAIVADWHGHTNNAQQRDLIPSPEPKQVDPPKIAAVTSVVKVERIPIEKAVKESVPTASPTTPAAPPIKEPTPINPPNATENHPPATMGIRCDENPRIRHDGVLVSSMIPGGPADEAGIKAGDWLLAVDDHYFYTVEELTDILRARKPGDKVNVRYRRYSTIYVTYVIMAGPSL